MSEPGKKTLELADELLVWLSCDHEGWRRKLLAEKLETFASRAEPIPMVLHCPNGHRHVDRGEFAARSHHTHACQECGIVWRPAIVATVGVQFLPGFKDKSITREEVIEAIRRGEGPIA